VTEKRKQREGRAFSKKGTGVTFIAISAFLFCFFSKRLLLYYSFSTVIGNNSAILSPVALMIHTGWNGKNREEDRFQP
jgi:hypothetical protein